MHGLSTREKRMVLSSQKVNVKEAAFDLMKLKAFDSNLRAPLFNLTACASVATFVGHQCRAAYLHPGMMSFTLWTYFHVYYYLV